MNRSHTQQYIGLSAAARALGVSETTLRRYTDTGVINPNRDSVGRRLLTPEDIEAVRQHIAQHSGHANRG